MANNYNPGTPNGGMDTLTVGGFGGGGGGLAASTTATAIAGGQCAAAGASKRPVRRGAVKVQPERPIRALYCLGLNNPIRKLCITITEWKYPL